MIKEKRFAYIRSELARKGAVEVDELSELLEVSRATIRRDLDEMESTGVLKRTHGGAAQLNSDTELPFNSKVDLFAMEKRAIGMKVAALVENSSVIACTGGTTAMSVIKSLKEKEVTILTNAINIAQELASHPSIQVIVTGGILQPRSHELVGHIANRTISDFYFDVALIGVDGISLERGISTYTTGEAYTALQYIDHAKQVWVVADHSKAGKTAPAIIAPISRVHRFITDPGLPQPFRKSLQSAGVEVVTAEM